MSARVSSQLLGGNPHRSIAAAAAPIRAALQRAAMAAARRRLGRRGAAVLAIQCICICTGTVPLHPSNSFEVCRPCGHRRVWLQGHRLVAHTGALVQQKVRAHTLEPLAGTPSLLHRLLGLCAKLEVQLLEELGKQHRLLCTVQAAHPHRQHLLVLAAGRGCGRRLGRRRTLVTLCLRRKRLLAAGLGCLLPLEHASVLPNELDLRVELAVLVVPPLLIASAIAAGRTDRHGRALSSH
eukprot:scaffold114639_cov60-Phaeocystis_antarctica.AAC.3